MILASVPSSVYSAQRRQFETPSPLDPTVERIRVTLTRESWPGDPDTTLVSIGLEVSQDGVTYPPISGCSATIPGGVVLMRDGITPMATAYVECSVGGVGLTTRKVRAWVDNAQPLRTAVTVEAF